MNHGDVIVFERSDSSPSVASRFTSRRSSESVLNSINNNNNNNNKDVEVAEYLLERKLHLSALEYYFEQLERGNKIAALHNFFTDIGFTDASSTLQEDVSFSIAHYQSMSTLDSIDIGRVSDDGNSVEEKVKVLEYELRKKNEEIQSLRNELTTLTVGRVPTEPHSLRKSEDEDSFPWNSRTNDPGSIQPHELRALSVLIHEQLLLLGYRITAVQFAEESESNGILEVESWEQVGINRPKPPKLLYLLRNYWSGGEDVNGFGCDYRFRETGVQTDLASDSNDGYCNSDLYPGLQMKIDNLESLQQKIASLESKNAQLLNQAQHWRNQLICLKREYNEVIGHSRSIAPASTYANQPTTEPSDIDRFSPDAAGGRTGSVAVLMIPETEETPVDNRSTPAMSVHRPSRSLCSRSSSTEFRHHMIKLLPAHEQWPISNECGLFQLAASLDEFVVLVADRIEAALIYLSNEGKVIILPLLTQLICLHSVSAVRDRLLRVLFNFFGPQYSLLCNDRTDSSPICSPSAHSDDQTALTDCNRHRLLILHACRLVASYLGPTRLEGELLPQLWSQLNERPPPSSSKRLLLVSACGAVAPSVPPHLQSSLMLSILESNLDEERNELVAAAAIRSLACLSTLMSDCDKLPQIIQRLTQLLLRGHPWEQRISVPDLISATSSNRLARPEETRVGSVRPTFVAAIEWLLPAVAQWCLELDSLHTTLIDPWFDHLDDYLLAARSTDPDISHDMATRCLGILNHLIPFLHAWLMITLIEPDIGAGEHSYWSAAQRWSSGKRNGELSDDLIPPTDLPTPDCDPAADSVVTSIDVRLILGTETYEALEPLFEQCLDQLNQEGSSPHPDTSSSIDPPMLVSTPKVWHAKLWLDKLLLPKLGELMMRSPRPCVVQTAKAVNVSLYKHNDLLENFVNRQYTEHFACPWFRSPQSDLMVVCLCTCQFLASFGQSVGVNGVKRLLSIPLRDQLMNRTELGNFEYDHDAMQTGLLAAYCCLLSSVKAKSESNKVRMLITNAIFLHTREGYSLDSIRLAIWCLCLTTDLEYAVNELILPALRPCVSCADSIVRRAVASLLHSLIEALRFARINRLDEGCLERPGGSAAVSLLLNQLFQLVSQLARDDLTGLRRRINADEADWSVLAVALGPLYSLFTLCRTNPIPISPKLGANGDGMTTFLFSTVDTNSSIGARVENADFEEQLLELVELQFNLVTGMLDVTDSPSGSHGGDSEFSTERRLMITQQRFWGTLTHALISLADRLIPVCSDGFRDKVILPWLYQLADMNNSLPNLDQRTQLADRLFAVFSTAAYSVQLEESLLLWLVPGLDRVRLDLVEAGDVRRSHEVEQLLNDLYSRIKADEPELNPSKPKDQKGFRNTVSLQFARVTNRANPSFGSLSNSSQPSAETVSTTNATASTNKSVSRVRIGRLSLRRR